MSKPVDPDNPDRPPRSQAPAWECRPGGSGLRHGMAGAMLESIPRPEPGNEGTELPSGWIIIKLSEITSDVTYGYTAKSTSENIGPHLLRITDIQDNKVNWESVPYCLISVSEKEKYQLKENDLVFARTGATVGKSYLIKGEIPESVFASYLIRVRCVIAENIYYFAHFFKSAAYWTQITNFSAGIGQPNVNGTKLKELSIPFPPLAEQKQIAARLDALLAQVDTLKTRLESIPTILKRFRQSVLAAAVSGKLTEQWRGKNKFEDVGEEIKKIQDVRNNEGAVGKKRKPDFSFHNLEKPHRNIPREWKLVQLGEVINELTDYHANGSYEVLKQHVELKEKEDFACMIRATNFEKNNFNDLLIYITKDAYNFLEKSKLFGGEVLMCKIGNAGSVYYMPNLNRPASLAMNLFAIRFNNELVNSKYIYFYLKSQFGENDIQKYVRGVATKSIDKQSVRSIFVNLPSFNEQTEIVRRVDQLFAFADQIEQRVAEAKKRVDHLTQSILAKAFRGDLTSEWRAQNPDMISAENSAEALLARIKAERAGVQASGKASKRRSEA